MSAWRLWPGRLVALVRLALWGTAEVVRASVMVARDTVAPSARLVPGVVVVPLDCDRWSEVAVLTGLLTLTPGTLVVGIPADRTQVWVHGMYAADPEELRREVRTMQHRVLRALRHPEEVPAP